MNREIKFRAWDGVDYLTKPFNLLDIQNGKIQFASSDTKIMQYTGLKDKNGFECYEKDYDDDGNMIDWCERCCGYQFFLIDVPSKDVICCHNCEGNFMIQDHISDFKIIGNIFETPKLLNHE